MLRRERTIADCLREAPWPELERVHREFLRAIGQGPVETLIDDLGARLRPLLDEVGVKLSRLDVEGARLWVARLPASRPAFGRGQRQALLVGACLDPTRPWPPLEVPDAIAGGIARGGLIAAHALTLLRWLAERLQKRELVTGRDLVVIFEGPSGKVAADQEREARALSNLLASCAFAVAETGGWPVHAHGTLLLPVAVARKGRVCVRVRARGEIIDPGRPGDQGASGHLVQALGRVLEHSWPFHSSATARAYVQSVVGGRELGPGLLLRALLNSATYASSLRRLPEQERLSMHTLLHDTLTLTRLSAGTRDDLGDEVAEAILDLRLLPGRRTSVVMKELSALLGDALELEVIEETPAVEADLHAPLLRILIDTLQTHMPGARALPSMQTADIPGLGWRQAEIPCYGFAPVGLGPESAFDTVWRTGRAKVDSAGLAWGLRVFVDALTQFLVQG